MFHIDVYKNSRFSHSVERRYSQFEDLHKELRKFHTSRTSFKLPAFPPKKVLKFSNKVIEQRRLDLQHYLQTITGHFQNHHLILEFMDLSRHSPTECEDTTTIMQNECTSYSIPVVRFTDLDVTSQKLVDPDDMITSAVLSSLYPPSSTTSSSSRDSLHGYVS